MRHGGKILIDQLAAHGVARVFEVPGESFLAALDGLHDEPRIGTIICRHEAGAAMMAEATAKLTGKPGIAFVTRGPGAANALPGLLIAREDETPMILFVGLPSRRLDGRASFQEFDVEAMFRGIAKRVLIVRETSRIPEAFAQAWLLALSGQPGPVVVAIPEDVFSGTADVADAVAVEAPQPAPTELQMAALADTINGAEWPMMIVGGPGWSREVQAQIEDFAARFDIPVVSAFRKQDYFDNRHRCYVGHLGFAQDAKLSAAVRAADVLLVVGAALGDVTTKGYALIDAASPRQYLIRVHPSADSLCAGPPARLGIVSSPGNLAEGLRTLKPKPCARWAAFRRDLRAAFEKRVVPDRYSSPEILERVVRHLSSGLPDEAVIAGGAGDYAKSIHRYFRYKQFGTCLAPAYGTMGYGLPAAIAARFVHDDRPIVAFAGDGCFMMSGQELATAVQYALPLVVLVADNGMFGTIRTHQERVYPGRVSGTTLVNPDFAAYARSFGAFGETVTAADDFASAFGRAMASGGPALLHLRLDQTRVEDEAALSAEAE